MCQEDGNCVSATFIEPLWQVKSINKNEMHPKSGLKAAQILSGISPKDIPSEYPSSFDYLINTSAAKKMGVSIPLDFLYSRELWISSAKSTSK
jgi:ABC-type uncharacterized transport system substrate-binding protein